MNERNLNEDQWEDRKQWSLSVGERRTMFQNQYTYICCMSYAGIDRHVGTQPSDCQDMSAHSLRTVIQLDGHMTSFGR